MAATQVVETLVIVSNSPIQYSTHLDDPYATFLSTYIYLMTYSRHRLLLCELSHLLRCKFPLQFCHYREKSEKYSVKGLSLQSNNYRAKEQKKLTKHQRLSSLHWRGHKR